MEGRQAVILTPHYDILPWLEPDWIIDTNAKNYKRGCLQRPKFELEIRQTNGSYWKYFKPHYYLDLPMPIAAQYFVGLVDGGAIVLQRSVLVKKEWTYKDLWREALFPLGVQLILETLKMIEDGKYSATPQDESLATWEPPLDQNTRLFRPELMMLP